MIGEGELYFDYNSTAPLRLAVRQILDRLFDAVPVNPHSPHRAGHGSREWLEQAREQVARLVGALPREVVFTSGGTEANLLALYGHLEGQRPPTHLLLGATEHSSILEGAEILAARGVEVTAVTPNALGVVEVDQVLRRLRPETALVALMSANNETGVLQPVQALARTLEERGVPFHVDAVQSAGRQHLNVADLRVSTLALSGHKLGGLPGAGALYLRSGTRLNSPYRGGRQERGLRGGTHNLPGAVALGAACHLAAEMLARQDPVPELRDRFEGQILERLSGVDINGAIDRRLPNTSNLFFSGVDGAELLDGLSLRGLYASTGSACRAGAPEPSHVLRAMGLPAARVRGSLRFSLGPDTRTGEVDRAAGLVAETVDLLRARR